ncbi:MAG TPA: hypothetical protein VIF62_20040 [Labilithrix sp.]
MGNRSASATVVDLEAFRQRKRMREASETAPQAMVLVPVWFCWVPLFAPQMM